MSDCHDPTTNRELAGRREEFRRRTGTYLRLGHDLFAAARFVADSGGRMAGPVLDVGTGKGIFAVELARRGFRVVSIDPDDSDQALASLLAREAGMRGRIRFVRGDGARLPFPAGRFGCVAMMEVLHHLPDLPPVARELARAVRPGGSLIVADFSEEGFELVARVHREEGGDHVCSGVTLEQAVAQLQGLGLRCAKRCDGELHRVAVFVKDAGGSEAGRIR